MNLYEQIGKEIDRRVARWMDSHFAQWRFPRVVVHVCVTRWSDLMMNLPPFTPMPEHGRPIKLWGNCTVIRKDLRGKPRDWYIMLRKHKDSPRTIKRDNRLLAVREAPKPDPKPGLVVDGESASARDCFYHPDP